MGLGKLAKGVGRRASGAAKSVGRAATGAGKQVGRTARGAGKAVEKTAKLSASAAKKVAKEAKKLEKPLDTATDIFAAIGGSTGKRVKEAVKVGLKNASQPEKILQGAAKGLAQFVKDPGCAVWQTNPVWWQVVAALKAAKNAGVVKTRRDAMNYLKTGGTIAAKFGVPKDLADSFFECAAKNVFS
jgi:hypothetical protein